MEQNLPVSHQIQKDPYRFVNLILFLLIALANSIPCQAFAGVSPAISQIYDVSGFQVNVISLFYPIMYVVMILPANYIIDQKGLKLGTLICQFMMCLGLSIRCLINYHFYYFILGTFLCSLGFCLITSAANKLSNIWFLDKEIFATKSLIIFVLFASDSVGFFLSTAFINKQSTKKQVQQFFLIQSVILILFHCLNALFFKDKPKNPQNYSSQIVKEEYLKNLKNLCKHKNYIKLFFVMTFVFANLSIIFVGVAWLGEAYDVSTEQCGYIIVIANIFGFCGCALTGMFLKDKYKLKCKIFLVLSFFAFGLMWIGFQTNIFAILYIAASLIGIGIFPFLTTILDFASQTAFPIGQGTTGGSLLFGGQTFGFIMIIVFSIYIDDNSTKQKGRVTQGVLLFFIIVGYLFLNTVKQDLKRKKYQQKIKVQQRVSLISQNATFLDD